jgi:glutamate/tyrosine decarboxylase-like PLP-dependent enzyme
LYQFKHKWTLNVMPLFGIMRHSEDQSLKNGHEDAMNTASSSKSPAPIDPRPAAPEDPGMKGEDPIRDAADLVEAAARRARRYLETVRDRRVFPTPEAVAALDTFDEPMPDEGVPADEVLAALDEIGSPATVASAGGRYFGFVIGGSVPAAVAASVLAAAWDQNVVMRVTSPVAARLEEIALGWVRSLLGLPDQSAGILVTDATIANFTCLAAARHALLERQGWNVEAKGLFGAPEIPVVVGEEVHASALKALALLGLGRKRVIAVPTDAQGRMRADALPTLSHPAIVCIQAGNVNSGAFDPAADICRVVHDAGGWVHVDGAFGLWAACSPDRAHLVQDFPQADSWATDGHKWLNVPYDCGIAFVREPQALLRAMHMHADYFQVGREWEPMHWGPDASRRTRGVEVWAALQSLGRRGVADLVERTCRYAARMADGLRNAGFEILNEVVINQVLVSFGGDARTKAVIDAVQRDGTCWCGGTVWHGRYAMRISVSSWVTDDDDIDTSLDAIVRIARGLDHEGHEGARARTAG